MADVYERIPKVELHCHLEGTVRPATVVELARANGHPLPVEDPTELYRYGSLDGFLKIFWLVQETLATPQDWERIAHESVLDAAPHGLRYREAFFTPARHLAAGQDFGEIVAALTHGLEAGERQAGVRTMLIADIDRAYGAAAGQQMVEALVELRRAGRADRVIGIGLDSTERGVDPRDFTATYEVAAGAGLRRTAHAGEDTGPDNIATAVEALRVERIDHGIAVVEDPELMKRLADRRIPFDVCPNSNIVIANRYPRLEDHPFRRMREAGLLVTLNTDDPAMTDLDLGIEYRTVAAAQGMSLEEMFGVALDGVEATWLDDDEKRRLRASFEREIAALRD